MEEERHQGLAGPTWGPQAPPLWASWSAVTPLPAQAPPGWSARHAAKFRGAQSRVLEGPVCSSLHAVALNMHFDRPITLPAASKKMIVCSCANFPSWASHAHSTLQSLHPGKWSLNSRLGKDRLLTLARVPIARWAGLGARWGGALALGSEGSPGLVGIRGLVSRGGARSARMRGCHLLAAEHGALLLLGGRTRCSCLGSGTTQEHQLKRSW